MAKKKTFEEVETAFIERGYKLLETNYINNTTKMKFVCPLHLDQETEITFKQLTRGEGCKYCGIKKQASSLSDTKRMYNINDVKITLEKNGCQLLEPQVYKNDKQPLKYKCKCGKVCTTNFRNYKKGSGLCKSCSGKGKGQKWTHEIVSKYFEEQGCKLLSVYREQEQKLKYVCNCGEESQVKLSNFLRGNRCKRCADKKRSLDYEYVKLFIEENGGTLLSKEYHNSTKQKLDIICPCGNEHSIRFLAFQRGERCPKCSAISKGEKMIMHFLDKNCIDYKYQVVLDDCRNINPLPFDFAIYSEHKLKCLIEFDGRQHFEPIEHFGGEEYLKTVKLHDNIKTTYCHKNNIPLYRISYKKIKNIDDILKLIV